HLLRQLPVGEGGECHVADVVVQHRGFHTDDLDGAPGDGEGDQFFLAGAAHDQVDHRSTGTTNQVSHFSRGHLRNVNPVNFHEHVTALHACLRGGAPAVNLQYFHALACDTVTRGEYRAYSLKGTALVLHVTGR